MSESAIHKWERSFFVLYFCTRPLKVSKYFMVINWYGENCFKLQSGQVTVMTDPPKESSGLRQPRFQYDILVRSLTPVPVTANTEDAFAIVGPGEYEVKKMYIRGFALTQESTDKYLKTAYLINDGELTLLYLGHISNNTLEPHILEHLADVDVLIMPGGGAPYIEQDSAVKIANQIQPGFIIPSSFNIPGLERKSDDVKTFLSEFGSQPKPEEKATIKKRDINPDETRVIVLEPSIEHT